MSRNYLLLQEMEKNRVFFSGRPVVPKQRAPRNELPYSAQSARLVTLDLVRRIFLWPMQDPPQVVVFAAIEHGNGCSQIAASAATNLAAKVGGEVCLAEGNFRSPNLSRIMGTTNYHGLADALLQPGEIRSFMKRVSNDGLWLLSSGPFTADSPDLLKSGAMRSRIAELRKEFAFVIVDAPPISSYSDAIALGKMADGLVLVVEADMTRRKAARIAVDNVRAGQVSVLGAVLNKRTFPIPERLYQILQGRPRRREYAP